MTKALTTSIFIEKATKLHGTKYDYSKVCYVNGRVKIKKHDEIKANWCETNNVDLCIITFWRVEDTELILDAFFKDL